MDRAYFLSRHSGLRTPSRGANPCRASRVSPFRFVSLLGGPLGSFFLSAAFGANKNAIIVLSDVRQNRTSRKSCPQGTCGPPRLWLRRVSEEHPESEGPRPEPWTSERFSKDPQGNERGAMGSKNPLTLEPLFFSAQHGSKNPGFVLRPLSPCAIALLGVA